VSDPQPQLTVLSEEFFIRVNDFIASANRIERRFDTHHAELVLLHAFSRYSAHHYRSTIKIDDQVAREDFATYIARGVEQLILSHLVHIAGEPQAAPATGEGSAAADGVEPSAE
jgi:hypothetical protein